MLLSLFIGAGNALGFDEETPDVPTEDVLTSNVNVALFPDKLKAPAAFIVGMASLYTQPVLEICPFIANNEYAQTVFSFFGDWNKIIIPLLFITSNTYAGYQLSPEKNNHAFHDNQPSNFAKLQKLITFDTKNLFMWGMMASFLGFAAYDAYQG